MADREWEVSLLREVTPLLAGEHTGHDLPHMLRVRRLALFIAGRDGGDAEVLSAAALLHDLFRGDPENKDKSKAVEFARAALSRCGFPGAKVEGVLACILGHSWSEGHRGGAGELPLEVLVFRDADRLDAMGAWGIGRTFAYGGAHVRPMGGDVLREDSLDPVAASSEESTVAHFHQKLLLLAENMTTGTGKRLAQRRHKLLLDYLAELEREAAGDLEG